MADIKISELPEASSFSTTDQILIVSGGATKRLAGATLDSHINNTYIEPIENNVLGLQGTILWTNQDTSEQWTTSRQITMNTSDYDCYRVIYFTGASGTSSVKSTGLIPKGYTTQLEFFYNSGSGNNNAIIRRREFAYNDDTHYTVSENMGADGGFPCRPYLVIGYNTGLF